MCIPRPAEWVAFLSFEEHTKQKANNSSQSSFFDPDFLKHKSI
jgi:hypothetical protein